MNAEAPHDSDSMATFRSAWYRLALLVFAGILTLWWIGQGPGNPLYGVALAWGTSSLEPAIPARVLGLVPRAWSRVPESERVLHRMVGVGLFARLLEASGWNHLIRPLRGFTGNKAGLLSLEEHARSGAVAHGLCLAIHIILAILALFRAHPWSGAFWTLFPATIVHLYPLLLQRAMILRLQPLLVRTGSR